MTITNERTEAALDQFADSFSHQRLRAPVLGSPADLGLEYEDVTFPASDGVPLEGWFIPSPGSRSVVIVNHPMGFSGRRDAIRAPRTPIVTAPTKSEMSAVPEVSPTIAVRFRYRSARLAATMPKQTKAMPQARRPAVRDVIGPADVPWTVSRGVPSLPRAVLPADSRR